ncbi:MAG: hypothetical protein AB7G75_25110 [Candidatus Binatia bacterium]
MRAKRQATLLELVQAVGEFATSDEEIVATVAHLINSGQVRLCGNFAGARIDLSPPLRVPSWALSSYPLL